MSETTLRYDVDEHDGWIASKSIHFIVDGISVQCSIEVY